MLDDAAAHDERTEAALKTDDPIYCAGCGHLVTRGRWRISRRDAHEHTVFNPAGRLFTIVCFGEAPGADEDEQGEQFVGKSRHACRRRPFTRGRSTSPAATGGA